MQWLELQEIGFACGAQAERIKTNINSNRPGNYEEIALPATNASSVPGLAFVRAMAVRQFYRHSARLYIRSKHQFAKRKFLQDRQVKGYTQTGTGRHIDRAVGIQDKSFIGDIPPVIAVGSRNITR